MQKFVFQKSATASLVVARQDGHILDDVSERLTSSILLPDPLDLSESCSAPVPL